MTETEEFTLVWWRGTLLTRRAYAVVSMLKPERREQLLEQFGFIDVEFEGEEEEMA